MGFLGKGITHPFRRLGGDFENAEEEANVISAVKLILGTRAAVPGVGSQGELPWRTDFGSKMHLLKHSPNNEAQSHLARQYAIEALTKWEPRIIIKEVTARSVDTDAGKRRAILVRVLFNFVSTNTQNNQVFSNDLLAEVSI